MKFILIILIWSNARNAATTAEFDSKSACYQAQEVVLKAWNGGTTWTGSGIGVLCTPKGDVPQ